MDGHVEFVKYPGKYPVSKVEAWLANGILYAGQPFEFTTYEW